MVYGELTGLVLNKYTIVSGLSEPRQIGKSPDHSDHSDQLNHSGFSENSDLTQN